MEPDGIVPDLRKVVLHVGCGPHGREALPLELQGPEWREIRLDIDPKVQPDVIGSITDMPAIAGSSVAAIWSAHNLEHLEAHEVPVALREFLRVLVPGGFVWIVLPDLQRVAELVAADRLEEPAYESSAGPIAPLDMIYGHRASLAAGNVYMAHRTGFTCRSLGEHLVKAGFEKVRVRRKGFDVQAWAQKAGGAAEK